MISHSFMCSVFYLLSTWNAYPWQCSADSVSTINLCRAEHCPSQQMLQAGFVSWWGSDLTVENIYPVAWCNGETWLPSLSLWSQQRLDLSCSLVQDRSSSGPSLLHTHAKDLQWRYQLLPQKVQRSAGFWYEQTITIRMINEIHDSGLLLWVTWCASTTVWGRLCSCTFLSLDGFDLSQ